MSENISIEYTEQQSQPEKISEDHVTNLIYILLSRNKRWNVSFINPPSGSWKVVDVVHNNLIYRFPGPKQGGGEIKRPDVVGQWLDSTSLDFLIFESKIRISDCERDLFEMMELYMEQVIESQFSLAASELDKLEWYRIKNLSLSKFKRKYVYGFGFLLDSANTNAIASFKKLASNVSAYPCVLCGVDMNKSTLIYQFSSEFPKEMRKVFEHPLRGWKHVSL